MVKTRNFASGQGKNVRASGLGVHAERLDRMSIQDRARSWEAKRIGYTAVYEHYENIFNTAMNQKDSFYG